MAFHILPLIFLLSIQPFELSVDLQSGILPLSNFVLDSFTTQSWPSLFYDASFPFGQRLADDVTQPISLSKDAVKSQEN